MCRAKKCLCKKKTIGAARIWFAQCLHSSPSHSHSCWSLILAKPHRSKMQTPYSATIILTAIFQNDVLAECSLSSIAALSREVASPSQTFRSQIYFRAHSPFRHDRESKHNPFWGQAMCAPWDVDRSERSVLSILSQRLRKLRSYDRPAPAARTKPC